MAAGDAGRAPPAAVARSLVESFCAVTSATPQEAAFFLDSHRWAFESAVRSFYDSAEGDAAAAADPVAPPVAQPPAAGGGAESEDEDYMDVGDYDDKDYAGDDDDVDAELAAAFAAMEDMMRPLKRLKKGQNARDGSDSGSRPSGANGRGNFGTRSDLGSGKRGRVSDEDSDEDGEWAPPPEFYNGGEKSEMAVRDRSTHKNNVDEVFKQAKRKGAKKGSFEPRKHSSRNVSGTGRLLTGETVQPNASHPPEDDPENASFLEEPVKRTAPFQGERRTHGTTPSDTTSVGAASSMATATKTITVDDSLPSTSLQIRFADGSRLVARFNTSHTIGDVRIFIDSTRAEASEYTLKAGFPPKVLDDLNKTIEEAGVAKSVIIQEV